MHLRNAVLNLIEAVVELPGAVGGVQHALPDLLQRAEQRPEVGVGDGGVEGLFERVFGLAGE